MDSTQLTQTATRLPSADLTGDHAASITPVLTASSVVIRNNNLFTVIVDDELACLDEPSGNYYGLNRTGRLIWELLEMPLSVQTITNAMIKRYPEAHEQIPAAVMAYLSSLVVTPLLSVSVVGKTPSSGKTAQPIAQELFSPPYCAPSLCALSVGDNTHKTLSAAPEHTTIHGVHAGS